MISQIISLAFVCFLNFYLVQQDCQSPPGLGFSRPKPVFPVRNGINWDKPVFPSFSRPKLGKTVQNWEKLCSTIFQAGKSFQKCDVSNTNLTG